MEKVRDEVVANIRACLVSTKGQITLRQLENDYRTLLGERIPYARLGHRTLEEFLTAVPSLVLMRAGADLLVDAAPSHKSSHISTMVMRQKPGKAKLKPREGKSMRAFYGPQTATPPSRWRPQKVTRASPRATLASHSQQVVQRRHYHSDAAPPSVSISERLRVRRDVPATPVASVPIQAPSEPTSYQSRTSFDMTGVSNFVRSLAGDVPVTTDAGGEGPALTSAKRRITKKMSEVSLERDSGTSSPTGDLATYTDGPLRSPATVTASVMAPASATALASTETAADFLICQKETNEFQQQASNGSMELKKPKPQAEEFIRTGNDMDDLKRFVKLNNLGELEIKHMEVKGKKHKPTLYHCKIKVGPQRSYTSYPNDFTRQADAEGFCAAQALDELTVEVVRERERCRVRGTGGGVDGVDSGGPLLVSSAADVLDRVPVMLERHGRALWSWQLAQNYEALHGELLPADWLRVIAASDRVSVQRAHDSYVLCHCTPGQLLQKEQSNTLLPGGVSVAANTVQFGEDGRLTAQVTCVVSPGEIWCCQCDTPDFEMWSEAMVQLEAAHAGCRAGASPGAFCAAHLDDAWYRVRVLDVGADEGAEDSEVSCFLIDYGEVCAVPSSDLYPLHAEFAAVQAQAFVCRLVGLEDLYEASVSCNELQNILYKEVILEATIDDLGNSNDKSIPVVMYDVSDPEKSLNEALIHVLATPKFDMEGGVTEVTVSHVESEGDEEDEVDVWVQVPGPGLTAVRTQTREVARRHQLECQQIVAPPASSDEREQQQLHLLQSRADGEWRRVRLAEWSPRGDLVRAERVDEGGAEVVRPATECLVPLDAAREPLAAFPPQALRVRLALDPPAPPRGPELAAALRRLLPVRSPALLRAVTTPPSAPSVNLPLVELFKRSADGGLFCINKSIVVDHQMKQRKEVEEKENRQQQQQQKKRPSSAGQGQVQSQQQQQQQQQQQPLSTVRVTAAPSTTRRLPVFADVTQTNVPSGGELAEPVYPRDSTDYFNVLVPFAVNPWNFVVQPLDSSSRLKRLMAELQRRYGGPRGPRPATPTCAEDVRPGGIYASRHDDGVWYRTSVLKVIHAGSISVFYCDFGYYANLSVDRLLPLDPDLLQLPYQALKARLHGIKPKHQKWTMDDCATFKDMVIQKAFVSVVKAINTDELYRSDVVLELILIDTGTDSDQYINKELIRLDIAVPTED